MYMSRWSCGDLNFGERCRQAGGLRVGSDSVFEDLRVQRVGFTYEALPQGGLPVVSCRILTFRVVSNERIIRVRQAIHVFGRRVDQND